MGMPKVREPVPDMEAGRSRARVEVSAPLASAQRSARGRGARSRCVPRGFAKVQGGGVLSLGLMTAMVPTSSRRSRMCASWAKEGGDSVSIPALGSQPSVSATQHTPTCATSSTAVQCILPSFHSIHKQRPPVEGTRAGSRRAEGGALPSQGSSPTSSDTFFNNDDPRTDLPAAKTDVRCREQDPASRDCSRWSRAASVALESDAEVPGAQSRLRTWPQASTTDATADSA